MITGAEPLFQQLSIAYADPLSLAAQQDRGHLTLIVVCYRRDEFTHVYDAFLCKSRQIMTVAHITPAFRFPIHPSRAVKRFIDARKTHGQAWISMYRLQKEATALFLETIYFQECLKLSIDHEDQHRWITLQIQNAECARGVLELNDFSDASRPVISLIDLDDGPNKTITVSQLADMIGPLRGRLLLYDRERNRSIAADRTAELLDPAETMRLATHLAEMHGKGTLSLSDRLLQTPAALASCTVGARETAEVTKYFEARDAEADGPDVDQSLADNIASALNYNPSDLLEDAFSNLFCTVTAPEVGATDEQAKPYVEHLEGTPSADEDNAAVEATGAIQTSAEHVNDKAEGDPPTDQAELNGAASRLNGAARLILQDAREEMERQLGPERTDVLWHHAARKGRIALPPAGEEALDFIRLLLTCDPPRRWMRFNAKRSVVREAVCADLQAIHGQYAHLGDHPQLLKIQRLWAKLYL